MTYFLRNSDNQTILDLELYKKSEVRSDIEDDRKYVDISSSIIIDTYSEFLLKNIDRSEEIIKDFYELSQLRGWLWEVYEDTEVENYDDICKEVSDIIKKVAKKYELYYVTD